MARAHMAFGQVTKKGALDSQPQVIKITSCLPKVVGFLQLLLSLKLKVALNTINQSINLKIYRYSYM
jgi:hypothetical protein